MRTTIFSLSIILFICLNNGGAIAQTTKTVGSGGDYATLHAAIYDVATGNLNGDIIFNIISDITETSDYFGEDHPGISAITTHLS
jgi:hypothetical protein